MRLQARQNAFVGIVADAENANTTSPAGELDAELTFYDNHLCECNRQSEAAVRQMAVVVDAGESDARAAVVAEDEVDALQIEFNHTGMDQALAEADTEYFALLERSEGNATRKVELDRRRVRGRLRTRRTGGRCSRA